MLKDTNTLAEIAAFHDALLNPPLADLRFDRTFRDIAEAFRQSLGAAHVTLWIPQPPAADAGADTVGRLHPAFTTFADDLTGHIPLDLEMPGTRIGQCFATGHSAYYAGLDDGSDAREVDLLRREELAGMWLIPLRAGGRPLGASDNSPHSVVAIALAHFRSGADGAALATETLEFFGRIAGRAIERAFWREQDAILQKAYEALDTLAGDRFAAIASVARVVADSMQFEACTILLADENRRLLQVLGTTGIESKTPLRRMQYPYGLGCTGWVALHKRTLATEDMDAAPQHAGHTFPEKLASPTVRQYLGTPLLSNAGDLLGVIRLRNKLPPAERAWPRVLNNLDRIRIERVAQLLAPLMALLIKERQIAATMERIQHDLTMPAMAIRDGAGVLLREPSTVFHDDLDRVRQKLEDIESFGEILLLNSEIMSFTPEAEVSLRCENVLPLGGFIAKLCKMLTPEARRRGLSGILYNQASFMSIRTLWIDPRLFQIALYNLLQNALKYSNKGTVITLEGEATRQDGALWYHIHVKNVGIGISDEELPRIFDRGFRSPRARRRSDTGLGLGLATARSIVERHGGRLVLTRATEPTIFTIQLPADLADKKPI